MADLGTPEVKNSSEGILILSVFKKAVEIFKEQLARSKTKSDIPAEVIELIIQRLERILEMSENYIFSEKDYKVYWEETYQELMMILNGIQNDVNLNEDKLYDLLFLLDRIVEFLLSCAHKDFLQSVKSKINIMASDIEKNYKRVEVDVERYNRLRNIADNAKTESIYNNAVTKYRSLEEKYRAFFYWALALTVGISLGTFFIKKVLVPDFLGNVEFWVLKASIIVVGITLITYFLKQSAHYQRLADQNYQTQVELQAYPSFMESIPTEEAASVRKELALKYFGREIDGAAHKDMSNLISDQMKSTTEMVKAATDVLKAKGP